MIYFSKFILETFFTRLILNIEVAERGTKAGAVTVVEMNKESAPQPEEPKVVYLDRPFIYMIIDTDNSIPLFIGTMKDMGK